MKIRVMGLIDQIIDVDKYEYIRAVDNREVDKYLEPYLDSLDVELVYGPAEDFGNVSRH